MIKKIKLQGFKSFAKPTELLFEKNFSVILGPNGSGKSNVTDAICFVLGKSSAKSMRAEKSVNLIYNGAKTGQPAKEASVEIEFDNSTRKFPIDTNTVAISRTVKHNGQSVYRINNETRTRQQILELLAYAKIDPEGHNIILQGDITHFMEMHPEERRTIIEDIAGISVYDDKKQKALLELEKVEKKLGEAEIILTERGAYLRELQKDRDQALKYSEYQNKIKDNKATCLHIQLTDCKKRLDDVEGKLNTLNEQKSDSQNKVSSLKETIASKRNKINSINLELEKKGETEQIKLQKELEELKIEHIKAKARIEIVNSEITKIENRREQLVSYIKELETKLKGLDDKKSTLIRELKQFKVKPSQETSEQDINKLQEQKQLLLLEENTVRIQLETTKKELETFSEDEIKRLKVQLNDITTQFNNYANENTAINNQLEKLHQELHEKEDVLSKALARDSFVNESFNLDSAVKRVLELKEKGVYGTIFQLGKTTPEYATALEVTAGSRINSLIVESDLIAIKCIKFLKENKFGTATFLPLNKIKGRTIEAAKNSKLALDLTSFDKKYKSAFAYVFGSTLIVDNLEKARAIGIGKARMVTLDGDLVEQSGAMVGGFRKKTFNRFKTGIDSSQLDEEAKKLRLLIENLTAKKIENEHLLQGTKEKKALIELECVKVEKSNYSELAKKKKELDARLVQTTEELNKVSKRLADELAKINIANEEKQRLEKEREDFIARETELKKIENELVLYRQEAEKTAIIIKQHNRELEEFSTESKNLKEKIKNYENLIKDKSSEEERLFKDIKSFANKRNKFAEEIQKHEDDIEKINSRTSEIQEKINTHVITRAKVVAELEAYEKEFEPVKDGTIRNDASVEKLRNEIKHLEKLIVEIGSVNMRAMEIYDDISREYQGLVAKADKLKLEKEDVLKLMSEIDGKKGEMFTRTYEIIADNFTRIFSSIATKGEAFLYLENEQDPLNAGLDIRVKIANNKYLDIKSLSGGEKTLTALAFIFAIQEYQPAPFYILDEVDAALDKANSEKLSKLFATYAQAAQYLVISHNDAIITEAEQIYGVAMQTNGTSKVVRLKF